jgi:hypothetical protein
MANGTSPTAVRREPGSGAVLVRHRWAEAPAEHKTISDAD